MIGLLFVTFGFASGVLARSFFVFGFSAFGFILLLGLIFLVSWRFAPAKTSLFVGIFLVACSLGAFRTHLADTLPPPSLLESVGETITLEGVVSGEPDVRDTSQRVPIKVTASDGATKVLAVLERYPKLSIGEPVRVSGKLGLPQAFDTEGGRVFRYDRYLAKDGIHFVLSFARADVIGEGAWSVRQALVSAKLAFLKALSNAVPEPEASLAAGLVAGEKRGLGSDLTDAFITTGLIHVVVLSGYNVAIVAEAVMRTLAFLPARFSALGGAFSIALFVLAAGAGAASVRAGIMASIALLARAAGRMYAAGRALLIATIAMLGWNPLILVGDPGFSLSLVATAGLIWIAPLVERRLLWVRHNGLRGIAASTVSAQVAVLPLLLWQTGIFSLVSLPANLLALPLVPAAMFFSALAGFMGLLHPLLAVPFGILAFFLNDWIIFVAKTLASLPFSFTILPAFPFVAVVLVYAVLAFFVYRLHRKSPTLAPLLQAASRTRPS